MSEEIDPRTALVERFFSGTADTYDFMVNFATLGIDRLWKRRMAELIPPTARRVLDLACGTGISTLSIAKRHPDCLVVGVELRDEYLQIAREKVKRQRVKNVELVLSRAEDYRSGEPFDCISSSYLAKYADLERLTRNSREMLNNDGLLMMQDFVYPPKAYLAWTWRVYFKTLQLVGSRVFPAWREIYYGLPRLIEQTRWVSELEEALKANDFRHIQVETLTAHGAAIVVARK